MALVYTKGTRVWLPDKEAGWVPGTVTSVVIPSPPKPDSEVAITVLVDGKTPDEGGLREFKCSFSTLQSASDTNGNNLSLGSSQDTLPPLRNPPLLESSEDLASLSNLNEPSGKSLAFTCQTSDFQFFMQLRQDMLRTSPTLIPASSWYVNGHERIPQMTNSQVALNPFSPVPLCECPVSNSS